MKKTTFSIIPNSARDFILDCESLAGHFGESLSALLRNPSCFSLTGFGDTQKHATSLTPCAFISRHSPTREQHLLTATAGFRLIAIGDLDAFSITSEAVFDRLPSTAAVCVVHPAAALALSPEFPILIFRNENRAPVGERPQFSATELSIFTPENEE